MRRRFSRRRLIRSVPSARRFGPSIGASCRWPGDRDKAEPLQISRADACKKKRRGPDDHASDSAFSSAAAGKNQYPSVGRTAGTGLHSFARSLPPIRKHSVPYSNAPRSADNFLIMPSVESILLEGIFLLVERSLRYRDGRSDR